MPQHLRTQKTRPAESALFIGGHGLADRSSLRPTVHLCYVCTLLKNSIVFPVSPASDGCFTSTKCVFEEDQEPSDTIKVVDKGDSGGSKEGAGSCSTVGVAELPEDVDPEVDEVAEGEVEEEEEEVFDSANLGLDSDL